jgi:hypothetical protein
MLQQRPSARMRVLIRKMTRPARSDLQQRDKNVVVRESLAPADAGRASPGMRPASRTYDAAPAVDRYLSVRARQAQAYRAQLWLG